MLSMGGAKIFPEESRVIYQSKACPRVKRRDGKELKAFDALECLAAMYSHIPNKGEQMVRYYGYYSNVSRFSDTAL